MQLIAKELGFSETAFLGKSLLDAKTAISEKYDVVGYHLFTLDIPEDAAAECRNFAPLYDIPEESATGTSSGALLSYLHRSFKLPSR